MSHEIMQTADSRYAMAYREGDPLPWHHEETNPQTFAPGAGPAEIADAAGLDYRVQVVPNCFPNGSPIPDSFHISIEGRPDHVLGRFVAGLWKPVQNSDMLDLADMIRDRYGFEPITAGALYDGAKVFVALETGQQFTLPGNDTLVSNLLITVAHFGTEANKVIGCNTRPVCDNTVRAAIGEHAGMVVHDHRVAFDHDAIATAVGLNAESFGEFADLAQRMARHALTDADALDYFRAVLGGREKIGDNGVVRHSVAVRKVLAAHRGQEFVPVGRSDSADVALYVADRIDQIARGIVIDLPADVTASPNPLINPGRDMESARGTLWGGFNALTWSLDHAPPRDHGIGARVASNLLGDGNAGRVKDRAILEAEKLLAA